MKLAPIAFFAFNRPEHTRRVLESFSLNKESSETELHAFIDGPRNEEDIQKIEEVKKIFKERKWCKALEIHAESKNRGMAPQIISGLTKLCNEKGRVIMLEDDTLVSPYFLDFLNMGLNKYENEEKVMSVCGYLYPIERCSFESAFMVGGGYWGWGTWQRAWQYFDPDGNDLLARIEKQKLICKLNVQNSDNKYRMLKRQAKGEISSFAIRWHAVTILRNGLNLFPGRSLVQNIGFDGTGIHTYKSKKYDVELLMRPVKEYPEKIEESQELLNAVAKCFRRRNKLYIKVLERLRSYFLKLFKR